uniref:Uncharacterized protein n=1 Tax=Timema cristinae TaxID=61476 RepID=A0A7R9CW89_TIMCR|nr:unnamed protein product [Timema cristinae]
MHFVHDSLASGGHSSQEGLSSAGLGLTRQYLKRTKPDSFFARSKASLWQYTELSMAERLGFEYRSGVLTVLLTFQLEKSAALF